MSRAAAWVLLIAAACKAREPAPDPAVGGVRIPVTAPPATTPPVTPPATTQVVRDPHSQARPEQVRVRHLALELDVDFTARRLTGTARLELTRVVPGAPEVVLDTSGLDIEAVTDCAQAQPRPFTLGPVDAVRGQALTVQLASDCIVVRYRTRPDASALLWLEPAGTAGKRAPMLFTQSQAILARSWIPLQDSPGVRFTYDATIHVPPGLWALMSAHNPQSPPADGVWRFTQDRPIPSYLMALAVGAFTFKPIGPRTGVYAEAGVAEAAVAEFAEVDAMMAAAERLYGPYRWGRYDILVLPPSFPFGGMENPRLTFLTPTVINGDRALVSLIAHELAHSWSGNLVTGATWNDLWLNEGMTTYVERRIMEELRGPGGADLEWATGRMDLDAVLARLGATNPDTRLALDFPATRDPEEAPGDIAYEKGSLLLRTLEQAFGRATFDAFLRARFERLAFQSSDSATFERDAAPLFAAAPQPWSLADWLHQPGVPASAAPAVSARLTELTGHARAFVAAGTLPPAASWTVPDWLAFLKVLPAELPRARVEALDAAFHLTGSPNAVLAGRWLPIVVRADVRSAAPTVAAYAARVGRRYLVGRVYEAMAAENAFWLALARTTFAQARPSYHSITRDSISALLAPP